MKKHSYPHNATMILPKDGKTLWTRLMRGQGDIPRQIDEGSPIACAVGRFDDGTKVIGGVAKSARPHEYNMKFMWVFNEEGVQYAGWPIDTSDHEDFMHDLYTFNLTNSDEDDYCLKIVEEKA